MGRKKAGKTAEVKVPRILVGVLALFAILGLTARPAPAKEKNFCKKTTEAALNACLKEAKSDYWIQRGNCYNISDPADKKECVKEAEDDYKDAKDECKEQYKARLEVCKSLGKAAYDPAIDPGNFVDPGDIGNTVDPNPYFPLVPGYKWTYQTVDVNSNEVTEIITDEVLDETKEIMGVKCIVVHDVVKTPEGDVIEDTYDWYAQDTEGKVWYFGESSLEYEETGLVSTEGSWISGVDGAKPGIIMEANPAPGDIYRQEFSLGNAEDLAEVLSIGEETVSVPAGTYTDDILKTRDFTPLEPGHDEYKYYAPGVGVVKEENPEGGERVELVSFTTGE